MKYSALYPIVAGLALSAMLLPATALAEKKTPFEATETDAPWNFNFFLGSDGNLHVFDGKATFDMASDEPRVAGTGWYTIYLNMNPTTGASTLWGKFHLENEDGEWDGCYTGTDKGFTATCVGSGDYEGLVSRWVWTPNNDGNGLYHWKGYIVENGRGDVSFKVSGWRTEQELPPLTNPTQLPFYLLAPLKEGAGKASHLGVFTELQKIGLAKITSFPTPLNADFSGSSILKVANGDLLNMVAFGQITSGQMEVTEAYFAGGTGRFEHATGFFAGPLQGTPFDYTYTATGTIRY